VATSGPPARYGHAMSYDSQRGVTVLFGGAASPGGTQNDTWEWDGVSWTQVATSGPVARSGHAMAYDDARQRTLLFGGQDAVGPRSDTWLWDGASWQPQVFAFGPAARSEHAMCHDVARQRVVLFGGEDATQSYGDTWEWDGTTWTQAPGGGPTARSEHAMAYDGAGQRAVLYGGKDASGAPLGDTWTWDGLVWSPQAPASAPPARFGHAMAYDSWPTLRRVVLFGGRTSGSNSSVLGDTWEWDGVSWTQVATSGPAARSEHAMAYDALRRETVLLGGIAGAGGVLSDVWSWRGGWRALATPFGSGCGTPRLQITGDPNARPILGQTASALVSNVPPFAGSPSGQFLFGAVGFSRTTVNGFPLPLDLQSLGAQPGCLLYISFESGWWWPTVATGPGTATFSFAIPNLNFLLGFPIYAQVWSADQAGFLSSNGLEWGIGNV
jgi:hypothetical protein